MTMLASATAIHLLALFQFVTYAYSAVPLPPGLLHPCKDRPGGCANDYTDWIPDNIFKCIFEGKLTIQPNRTLYYDNEEIVITGVCFIQYVPAISVQFGDQTVNCVVEGMEIECRAPLFDTIGIVNVTVSHRGLFYEGEIEVEGNPWTTVADFIQDVDNRTNVPYILRWDPNLIGMPDTVLELKGFREDYYFDQNLNLLRRDVLTIINEHVVNSGTMEMEVIPDQPGNPPGQQESIKAIRYQLRLYSEERGLNSIMFHVYIVSNYNCTMWQSLQPNASDIDTITQELVERSPCPASVPMHHPPQVGMFVQDELCNPHNRFGNQSCSFFHSGATVCYKSQAASTDKVVECCYDENNSLILGAPGGGSVDFINKDLSEWQHFATDVIPWLSCCNLESQCGIYYEKRPSIGSRVMTSETTTMTEQGTTKPGPVGTESPVKEGTTEAEIIEDNTDDGREAQTISI